MQQHGLVSLQDKWLFAFKHLHELESIPSELQEAIFQRLFAIAQVAQLPAEERQVYESSLKDYRAFMSAQDTAHLEGYQEGKQEGIEEGMEQGKQIGIEAGKREMAQQLLTLNLLPPEQIAHIAGLSLDEVLRLKI